jgi:hypothetical protein
MPALETHAVLERHVALSLEVTLAAHLLTLAAVLIKLTAAKPKSASALELALDLLVLVLTVDLLASAKQVPSFLSKLLPNVCGSLNSSLMNRN